MTLPDPLKEGTKGSFTTKSREWMAQNEGRDFKKQVTDPIGLLSQCEHLGLILRF